MTYSPSEQARALLGDTLVCDMTMPWTAYGRAELRAESLPRMHRSGFDLVSLTLAADVQSQIDVSLAREARLLAERDLEEAISFPETLLSRRDVPTVATAVGLTVLLIVGRIPLLGIVAGAVVLLGSRPFALRILRRTWMRQCRKHRIP